MKNNELLDSPVNKKFEEVLVMNDKEFLEWIIDLRKTVVDLWDNKDLPPRVGYDTKEIAKAFNKLAEYPLHKIAIKDEETNKKDILRNTANFSGYVNEWFPTMMKTKISYSTKTEARSIYDYFADDSLLETFTTYAKRHFKRDSFYHYSTPISYGDVLDIGPASFKVDNAKSFFEWFEKNRNKTNYDYWLCPVKENNAYSGFNPELMKKKNIFVKSGDFKLPPQCLTNINLKVDDNYSIRLYEKGQKLFPLGLKAFRISFCQYAVNFPPLLARFIYEKYTDHIADQDQINIYDPSAGWGGRLIGALSVSNKKNIHYIGNDPNTDHNISDGRTKYHDIGDFFNKSVRNTDKLFVKEQSYEIFQMGSEVLGSNSKFQKYKGKLDFVFTSPPYWCKEVYSDDKEQSCHAYKAYEDWRDGFLKPTLETSVEYLRSNRYLAWNIADIVVDGKTFPLEQDSKDILKKLGMKYVTTLKMALAQMPGANRLADTGETETIMHETAFGEVSEEVAVVKGMMKNYCQINSNGKKMYLKFEPIFIFIKKG